MTWIELHLHLPQHLKNYIQLILISSWSILRGDTQAFQPIVMVLSLFYNGQHSQK